MAYTPPAKDAVNFTLTGGYTPPVKDAIDFDLSDEALLQAEHEAIFGIGDIQAEHEAIFGLIVSGEHEAIFGIGDIQAEHEAIFGLIVSNEHEAIFGLIISNEHEAIFGIGDIQAEYEAIFGIGDIQAEHEAIFGIGDIQAEHEAIFGLIVSGEHETIHNIIVSNKHETTFNLGVMIVEHEHEATFGLIVSNEHECIYSLRPVIQTEHEIIFSIGYVQAEHKAIFSLQTVISFEHEAVYQIALLQAEHETIYSIKQEATAEHEAIYMLANTIASEHEVIYSILSCNPVFARHVAPYVMAQTTETILDVILSDIDFLNINITTDEDSFCFSISAVIANIESWTLCTPGKEIVITINAEVFNFLIDERTRTRRFGEIVYNISGRSGTKRLMETQITKTWEATTARAVVAELCGDCGISYDYQIIDWAIPTGVLTADGEYPIEIIRKITDACGGIMQTTPAGVLVLKPKYSAAPVDYSSPVLTISDTDDVFSITESKTINRGYNGVYVMDYQESYNGSHFIVQEDNFLKIWVYPFQDTINLQTSYTETGLTLESMGEIEEELIESIEIIDGTGSVSSLVFSIESAVFANSTDLGSVTFDNTSIFTATKGQSILDITYKTKYHKYKIANINDYLTQFYIEEAAA